MSDAPPPLKIAWDQVAWRWAGQCSVAEAIAENLKDVKAVQGGAAPRVFAFEPAAPAVTLGRRAQTAEGRAALTSTLARSLAHGWPNLDVDRGGLATLHLPGQIVVLVALPVAAIQLRSLVRHMLQAAAATATARGCPTELRSDSDAGLWLGAGKLASIGLSHRAGVATHGLALNVAIDCGYGGLFTLCGHTNAQLASLYPQGSHSPVLLSDVAQTLRAYLLR